MNDHQSDLPEVSIGLPVYNGELFLKKALDSLLNQTYSNFELIISDNHKSPNSRFLWNDNFLRTCHNLFKFSRSQNPAFSGL